MRTKRDAAKVRTPLGRAVHPAAFQKWRPFDVCTVCGHLGRDHKGLWHDYREFSIDRKNLRDNPVCMMQCRKCRKIGGRLAVCYDDGCEGRAKVNPPFPLPHA
jgi:hypothetical protein